MHTHKIPLIVPIDNLEKFTYLNLSHRGLANTAFSPFSNYVPRFLVFMPLLKNLFYLLDPNHPSRPNPNATSSMKPVLILPLNSDSI